MLTVASWNMHKGPASWQHLSSLVLQQGVSVALVQEAGPPGFASRWLADQPASRGS